MRLHNRWRLIRAKEANETVRLHEVGLVQQDDVGEGNLLFGFVVFAQYGGDRCSSIRSERGL